MNWNGTDIVLGFFWGVVWVFVHLASQPNVQTNKRTPMYSDNVFINSLNWSHKWFWSEHTFSLYLSLSIYVLFILIFFLSFGHYFLPCNSFWFLLLAPLLWQSLRPLRVQPWVMMKHQWAVMNRSPPSPRTPLERPPRNPRIIMPPLAHRCQRAPGM